MRKLLLWPFLALVIAGSTAEGATTLCVKPGGGSGCFATITLALAAASAGDTIRVAAGTYVETLLVDKNVTLKGGWNASFTQRDLTNFVSEIQPAPATGTSVVSISGTFGNAAASTPTLDGLLITGGPGVNHGGACASTTATHTSGTARSSETARTCSAEVSGCSAARRASRTAASRTTRSAIPADRRRRSAGA
jgi:hypothetical protein